MSKTKQQLEEENEALRAGNEALRGLIAAIAAALDVPQAITEDEHHELREYALRTAHIRGALTAFGEGSSARYAAATIAGYAEGPVSYRVYRPQAAAPEPGCPAVSAGGEPCTAPHTPHQLPHRASNGTEWDDTAVTA